MGSTRKKLKKHTEELKKIIKSKPKPKPKKKRVKKKKASNGGSHA